VVLVIGVHDQTTAINSLPAPPARQREQASVSIVSTGTDGPQKSQEKGAKRCHTAHLAHVSARIKLHETGEKKAAGDNEQRGPKPKRGGKLRTTLHAPVSGCIDPQRAEEEVRLTGFEPPTYGLGNGRPDRAGAKGNAELRRGQHAAVPTVVPSPPESSAGADLPPELAEFVACWAALPEAVKAGFLAMVRAAAK